MNELLKLSQILYDLEQYDDKLITDWICRSRDLIKKPNIYDYKLWGLGSEYLKAYKYL